MWAMEMHPSDRPSTVRAFQSALEGKTKRPRIAWREKRRSALDEVVRGNWLAIVLVLSLLVVALF